MAPEAMKERERWDQHHLQAEALYAIYTAVLSYRNRITETGE